MTEHDNQKDPTSDAEILFPDEFVTIEGDAVLVREFRYLEGLRAIALARPLLNGLAELLEGGEIDALALDGLIAEHYTAWIELISISTDQPAAWIEGLSSREGQALSMTFWRVNSRFFMERLVFGGALARTMRQMVNPALPRSGSPSSSTPSSSPATGATPARSATD